MKKILKIAIMLILILILFGQTNTIYSFSLENVISQGDSFIEKGKSRPTTAQENNTTIVTTDPQVNTTKLNDASSSIFNVLFMVGVILSVGIGGYLGIKIMVASAEDKAKTKELLIPYICGCIVIFGAFTIWKLVVTALSNA